MFKYTITTLNKLEDLLKESNYVVRYEKGNFKSGFCVLRDKRVVVINKYFNTESRINCFIDILPLISIDDSKLSEKSLLLLKQILQLQPAA